jgi:hypothetical protein
VANTLTRDVLKVTRCAVFRVTRPWQMCHSLSHGIKANLPEERACRSLAEGHEEPVRECQVSHEARWPHFTPVTSSGSRACVRACPRRRNDSHSAPTTTAPVCDGQPHFLEIFSHLLAPQPPKLEEAECNCRQYLHLVPTSQPHDKVKASRHCAGIKKV